MPETVKVRCIQEVTEIYANYRPELGKVYNAEKGNRPRKRKHQKDFVILNILDKRIVLRRGEYEVVTA